MPEYKRVVITGVGALTPIGNDAASFGRALRAGVSGAAPITHFDASKFKTRFACEVKGFDPLRFLDRQEVRKYDLFTQYALVAADEAIRHAELEFDQLNRNRIGVIWGSGVGGLGTLQEQISEFAHGDGTPRFNPFMGAKMIIDIAAGLISIKHGLRGLNFATVSACATSTTALIDAFNYIRWGKADVLISGGSEAAVNETGIGSYNALRALSTRNEDYATASRPFDVSRDGFVVGEGAGALILEEYEHARRRGVPILAELVGGGMAADAYHLTGTHPEGEGAYLSMEAALNDAGLHAAQIDYLNAHATSTGLGDASELRAIGRVFGPAPHLHISATKSMTGHLLGAAGAVEAIACVQAVQQDVVPPTINTAQPDPEITGRLRLTLGQPAYRPIEYAMSNSFGFGGHTATLIVKKFSA
ncbi:beta-ketoacyl-ACP synthase II [Hymenobacter properus]|uniref:3-oxoacyl-[acyl-carrier-protein] synthase 2 n=1 Tax=Hymenobacter properus TaxID=2791026 RepID=A0A931BGA9_9BACT|nr:beta-ketoacyl-ACP synthase II [Hymenobacter properus]MBF9141116.1 beta-ketoacyl-ACP synthase II [Hymenobacter properus]MBR7719925.1 beta-ketoacyl-ACP synthase II [Microvirga sp. SRT04]